MSHWHLTLETHDRTVFAEHKVYLMDMQDDYMQLPQLVHIEGTINDGSTWRFTQIGDDTQVRDAYVCDIGKSTYPIRHLDFDGSIMSITQSGHLVDTEKRSSTALCS